MKKVIHFLDVWGVAVALVISSIVQVFSSIEAHNTYYGSVHSIGGTTVLYTVFVDTPGYEWDFSNQEDAILFYDIRDKMGIAAEYIEESASSYNEESNIIYDIEVEPVWDHVSLYESFDEEQAMDSDCFHTAYCTEFETFFDEDKAQKVKKSYHADNVFCFFILKQSGRSYCIPCGDPLRKTPEYCVMFSWNGEYDAQGFAHEFLHSCGAIDLYREDDRNYGISAEYDHHLEEINSHDVMRWSDGEKMVINAEFSDLDAYYCGLTSAPEDVEKYNLEKSIFDRSTE